MKLEYPELFPNQIFPDLQPVCTMHIKRQFSINLNKEHLFLKHQINKIIEKDVPSNQLVKTDIIPNVIHKYRIVNASLVVKPLKPNSGLLWGSYTHIKDAGPKELCNLYTTTHINVNEGIRIVYIPPSHEFAPINQPCCEDTFFYIYSTNNMTGLFEVELTLNINYLPLDAEFFVPKQGECSQEQIEEFKNAINKNIITAALT